VFAFGVITMELIVMENPARLYDRMWPKILKVKEIVPQLLEILTVTLDEDPHHRKTFTELFELLDVAEEAIGKAEVISDECIDYLLETPEEEEDDAGLSVAQRN
jgi:hypothetical protein